MIKYKSREYCKDSKCQIQTLITAFEGEEKADFARNFCHNSCEAYNFHQWLEDNNYELVRDLNYTVKILKDWFAILQENLENDLDEIDISEMGLDEPLEMIENSIYDLEGVPQREIEKMNERIRLGDRVHVDYGGGYGLISDVTDWRYSPEHGFSYEVFERPGRYWSSDRVEKLNLEGGSDA